MNKTFPLAAAAALALAAPAAATPKQYWFTCGGTTPVQTIDVEDYNWAETAPTASYQEGAGCGFADIAAFQGSNQPNPFYDAGFGGHGFKGAAHKFDLTLYGPEVSGLSRSIDLQVIVNGASVATLANLQPSVSDGPDDAIKAYTYSSLDIDLPETTKARTIVFAVALHYVDSSPGWLEGAKEVPSNVVFTPFEDLTQEEQDEITGAGS